MTSRSPYSRPCPLQSSMSPTVVCVLYSRLCPLLLSTPPTVVHVPNSRTCALQSSMPLPQPTTNLSPMPRSLQSTLSQHLMPHLPQSTMTLRTPSASLGTNTTSRPPYSRTCPLQSSMSLTVVHAPFSRPCSLQSSMPPTVIHALAPAYNKPAPYAPPLVYHKPASCATPRPAYHDIENLALVFFFFILICVRNNPKFKLSFSSEAYSWWNSHLGCFQKD